MEQERSLSGEESLELIQSMINKAKHQFSENGHLYLLWGWVVLLCSVAQFILIHVVQFEQHYIVWTVTWLAAIYQMIYSKRKKRDRRVRTYTDDILSFVWLVFVVLMFLFGYLLAKNLGERFYEMINPAFLALYGMPTLLSGVILKFRPLMIGAIACWVLCVLSTFVSPHYQILFLGLGVVLAWIIPGYTLQARNRRQQN